MQFSLLLLRNSAFGSEFGHLPRRANPLMVLLQTHQEEDSRLRGGVFVASKPASWPCRPMACAARPDFLKIRDMLRAGLRGLLLWLDVERADHFGPLLSFVA